LIEFVTGEIPSTDLDLLLSKPEIQPFGVLCNAGEPPN